MIKTLVKNKLGYGARGRRERGEKYRRLKKYNLRKEIMWFKIRIRHLALP